MKKLYYYPILLLVASISCSTTDDDETSGFDDGRRTYHLTITEDADATRVNDEFTRALLVDEGITLSAKWEEGDLLTYCNISRINIDLSQNKLYPTQGNLTAVSNSATSQFTGDVICQNNDFLALAYPSTTFEFKTPETASYVISLDGQDGSLTTLSRFFNYQYGVAEVISVDQKANMANATLAEMFPGLPDAIENRCESNTSLTAFEAW